MELSFRSREHKFLGKKVPVNTKLQPAGQRSGATLLDNPRHVIN